MNLRSRRSMGWVRLCLLMMLAFGFQPVAVPAQNLDTAGLVWAGAAEGVLKLLARDGAILLEVPSLQDVKAVAPDGARSQVWLIAGTSLRLLSFDGTQLFSLASVGTASGPGLVLDPDDGSVWAIVGTRARHYGFGGQFLGEIVHSATITAAALDWQQGSLWVGDSGTIITIYDPLNGLKTGQVDAGKGQYVRDIDFASGSFYIATAKEIRSYTVAGALIFADPLNGARLVAYPFAATSATSGEIYQLRNFTWPTVAFDPFPGQAQVVGLVRDTQTGGVWVAAADGRIANVAFGTPPTVRQLWQFTPAINLRSIAITPRETVAPAVAIVEPSPNAFIGPRPNIQIAYSDEGSGVNPSTLTANMSGGGTWITLECSGGATGGTCTPPSGLQEAGYTIYANVKDNAENLKEAAAVGASVDAVGPALQFLAPSTGAVVEPNTDLRLAFSDAKSGAQVSTLSISRNGFPAAVTCSSVSPSELSCRFETALPAGAAELRASMRDNVGNSSTSAAVNVTVASGPDTTPPSLQFVAPAEGATVGTRKPTLELAFADEGGSGVAPATLQAFANGGAIATTCSGGGGVSGTLRCTPTPLPTGAVALSATIKDLAGNPSPPATVTFAVVASETIINGMVSSAGAPYAGAEVMVLGKPEASALSAADGSFSIADVPVQAGEELTVVARATVGGQAASAVSSGVVSVIGGISDAGNLALAPLCNLSVTAFAQSAGLVGTVEAMAVFDDGSGPQLYVGGSITSAGQVSVANLARWNGRVWSRVGTGANGTVFDLVVFDSGAGPRLYAAGAFTSIGGIAANRVAQWNGQTWSSVGTGFDGQVSALAVHDDGSGARLYAGGTFDYANPGATPVLANGVAKWTGSSWVALAGGLGDVSAMESLGTGTSRALYAGLKANSGGVRKWDGSRWNTIGRDLNEVVALAWFDDGSGPALYVANGHLDIKGKPVADLLKRSGNSWVTIIAGTYIKELLVFDDGSGAALYVADLFGASRLRSGLYQAVGIYGGDSLAVFDDGSGPTLFLATQDGVFHNDNGLAKLVGGQFVPHGVADFNAAVNALTVFDDGLGPALYAAGGFIHAGVRAERVVRWDGRTWSPLGDGLPSEVYALASADVGSGRRLFAAHGDAVSVWEDGRWQSIGSASSWVLGLAETPEGLVAVGKFTSIGGQPARGVARWDGSRWSPVGAGVDDAWVDVRTVALHDAGDGGGPKLYVGGSFLSVAGNAAQNVAVWDGQRWSGVGSGLPGWVNALHSGRVGATPTLYAGGSESVPGGTRGWIKAWTNPSWTRLGGEFLPHASSTSASVDTLWIHDDGTGASLYAGGQFSKADTVAAPGIARWNGNTWVNAGLSIDRVVGDGILTPGKVLALASFTTPGVLYPESLFAGGDFAGANGTRSRYFVGLERRCPDTVAPTIRLTAPGDGLVTAASLVTFIGSVSEPATLTLDGDPIAVAEDLTFSRSVALAPGTNAFVLSARDPAGNTGEIARSIVRDASPPTIQFLSPAAGSTVFVARPAIKLAVSDDFGVDEGTLTISHDGAPIEASCSFVAGTASCVLSSAFPNGQVVVAATIRDRAGNVSVPATLTFTVNASPGSGATTVVGRVQLITGAPVANAEVSVAGHPAVASSAADGSFSIPDVDVSLGQLLDVTARISSESDVLLGFARDVTPTPGGLTDAGVITLEPPCPPAFASDLFSGVGVDGLSSSRVMSMAVFDDGSGPALYVGGRFDSAGGIPARNIARWDGHRWSALDSGTNQPVRALAVYDDGSGPALYAGGSFVTAGGVSAIGIAKWKSGSWSALGSGTGGSVYALEVYDSGSGPALYVGGRFATAGGVSVANIARWKTGTWSGVGAGVGDSADTVYALRVYDAGGSGGKRLYAGGDFSNAGALVVNHLASWNGSSWASVGGGVGPVDDQYWSVGVYSLGVFAGSLYAGGYFWSVGPNTLQTTGIARWDGRDWSPVGGGLPAGGVQAAVPQGVQALAAFDDGTGPALYAMGTFHADWGDAFSLIARWNGSQWSSVASGLQAESATDGMALAAFDSGSGPRLFAGGGFHRASDTVVERVTSWNGSAWAALGNGIDAGVRALEVFDDGSGKALYAGGDFETNGGRELNHVGRWNGSSWSSLGAGTDAPVYALEAGRDLLVAGGSFTKAGGLSASRVAAWNGVAWTPLGAGLDGTVRALAWLGEGSGSRLVAAGDFLKAGGQPAARVAAWDGGAWQPLGAGLNGPAFALTVFDDGNGPALYVGGSFSTAGGTNASRLARWDGTSWSSLGAGVNGTVYALAVYDDGSGPALYAAGNFSLAGGVAARNLARWNGATWAAVGDVGGSSWPARSLSVFDDGTGPALYVGGTFTSAGGSSAFHVARWGGTRWSALGSGLAGPVSALSGVEVRALTGIDLGNGPELYLGGEFALADGSVSTHLASWRRELGCDPGDATPPTLSFTQPTAGQSIGARPQLILAYSDAGSGALLQSLRVTANGNPVAVDCAFSEGVADCQCQADLPSGAVTLTAVISDAAGNVSTPATVAVEVAPAAATLSFTSPAEGAVLASNQFQVLLRYSGADPETFAIQISAPGAMSLSCELDQSQAICTPEPSFPEGATTLTATIANSAGEAAEPAVLHFTVDTLPPTVSFTTPAAGAAVRASRPQLRLALADAGAGIDEATLELREAATLVAASCVFDATGATCTPTAALADGAHTLAATIGDRSGKVSTAAIVSFTVDTSDTTPPAITVTTPTLTDQPSAILAGSVSEQATLTIDGAPAAVAPDLTFSFGPVPLAEGPNAFELVATDLTGNVGTLDLTIVRATDPDVTPPDPVRLELVTLVELASGEHRLAGAAGAVTAEPGLRVVVTNVATGSSVEVNPAADGGFELTLSAVDGDTLRLVARDAAGNDSAPGELTVSGTTPVPADPAAVAPPLDPSSSVDACGLVRFFWTGAARVQFGVQPDAIDCGRLAVVRGRVLDRTGAPIAGVRIDASGQPEHGFTFSRSDGAFDFALRAQDRLVVTLSRSGYFSATRTLRLLAQQFTTLDDIVLLQADAQVTVIEAGAAAMQVARGSVVSDALGTRQATVLFPAGTTATLRLPDGTSQPLSALQVRATEHATRASVPATLPTEQLSSYVVELSVDAAESAGAGVEFSRAVPVYVENHLEAPIGNVVDVVTLDRATATWLPDPSGRIVEVLSISAGLADLDVTGSGSPASPAELQALGIDDTERAQLASLYAAGQGLARIAVTHFSGFVQGWFRRSAIPTPPSVMPPPVAGDDKKLDHPSITPYAGTIDTENQILGETLGLAGTPLTLNYRSDRVPGRKAPYRLQLRLLGAQVPFRLHHVELTIDIAGQHYKRSFDPAPNLSHEFVWDRREGYGREVAGQGQWTATVSYVFGVAPSEAATTYTYSGALGTLDAAAAAGIGGWTLSAQHLFDRPNGTLYYGDGRHRELQSSALNPRVLERVAGTGETGSSGDGFQARQARLTFPLGLSVTPDGSLLIADYGACRVRKVSTKDGSITTIAGSVCGGANGQGDGGHATGATLAGPVKAVESADGIVYVVEYDGHRVRAIDRSGVITTVAGNGAAGCSGNQLAFPHDAALAADGSLWIANVGMWDANSQQRSCDSIQRLVRGRGLETVVGRDPFPSVTEGWFNNEPQGVATAPDGSVYFTPINALVRRPAGGAEDPLHPDWVIAGMPRYYGPNDVELAGDGMPASAAATRFFLPGHLAVGGDGTVYIADRLNRRIRTVSPAERVDTLVGGGSVLPAGDGIFARDAALATPTGIALDPKRGFLYFADGNLRQVWKVRLGEPKAGETVVPEEDGSLRYVFDDHGHHLRTEDGISGQVLLTFSYTDYARAGGGTQHLLTSIEDAFGNVTQVNRAVNGEASGVVAPFGQATTLVMNGGTGYLSSVSAAGETVQLGHDPDGLLRTLIDPRSGTYSFDYDPEGRLSRVADPAAGSLDLTYTEQPSGWKVHQQTALGRTSEVEVFLPPEDASIATPLGPDDLMLRVVTDSAGLQTRLRLTKDGKVIATGPDGTTSTARLAADPLLADLAPYAQAISTQTPSGLRHEVSNVRAAQPTIAEGLDAATWSETATANGRSATAAYSRTASSVTYSSPESRQSMLLFDGTGRVAQAQVPGIAPIAPSYGPRGRVDAMTQGARQTTYGYDPAGYLQSVTDPLLRTVSFERDARGRVTKQTLPDSREVGFGYDPSGNLTSLTPPSRPPHTFGYNPVDQLETATPPDVLAGNDASSFAYNADHQLELITRPDSLTIDPAYDAATGRLLAVTTPAGTTSYSYEAATGRLASVTAPAGGGTIGYGYDGPLLTSVTQSGPWVGSVAYAHDRALDGSSNFWLASRTINGDTATSVSYQHDADGLLTGAGPLQIHRDAANGALTGTTLLQIGESLERNGFGEVTRLQAGFSGDGCTPAPPPFAGCTVVLDQSYVRDAAGRITEKTETLRDPLGGTSETHAYVYTFDPTGRLVEVKRDGVVWESYGYDGNSNRTSWSDPWGTGAATYDAQDRLLTYGWKTYTYTANGELATKSEGAATVGYTYDVLGNLRRVQLPNGVVIDYVIDAANRRIGKRVNNALVKGFLYGAGSSPVAELDGSGNVVATFLYATGGNVPDAMVRGSVTYRIVTDHLGSVRWVLDAQTGAVAQRMDYDAFGRVTLDTNPGFQPFGFAGGLHDYQTGLVRFGARDYDGETGRWTSKDPIGFAGGDTNLYGYVVGDPVNFSDPAGLAPAHDFRNFALGLWAELERRAEPIGEAVVAAACGAYNSTRLTELFGECDDVDKESTVYQVSHAATPFLFTRGKRGPKTDPAAPHNATIRRVAGEVTDGQVIAGGGIKPERLIRTPGGYREGRRADVLVLRPDGSTYGINVGRTDARGLPVKRERQAIEDLEGAGVPMHFVPYYPYP